MSTCPTCSQPISPLTLAVCLQSNVAARAGQEVKLTPHLALILDTIAKRSPHAVSITHLASKLYGAEDGPEDENNCIRVRVSQLRALLTPLHARIEIRYKTGYRLVLDELPAMREVAA